MTILTLQVMQVATPLTLSTKIQTLWPILNWFKENKLKLNLDKCHLIVSAAENAKIKLNDFTITNSKKEKLLGIIFDGRLKFQYHIENFCKKARLKLSVLSRVPPFVDLPQKKILFKVFQSQFSYCPFGLDVPSQNTQ